MNRRDRRAAAAHARRGGRTGYMHRLLAAHAVLGDQLRGKVVQSIIEHDAWCDHYKGRTCNCVPNIAWVPIDGGDAFVVAEDGSVSKTRRQ
jgi:hypothetical protein